MAVLGVLWVAAVTTTTGMFLLQSTNVLFDAPQRAEREIERGDCSGRPARGKVMSSVQEQVPFTKKHLPQAHECWAMDALRGECHMALRFHALKHHANM
eukprot:4227356-Pyramimonas_sp.AAC.1